MNDEIKAWPIDEHMKSWETVVRDQRAELNQCFEHYLDGMITWSEYCLEANNFDILMNMFHKRNGVGSI